MIVELNFLERIRIRELASTRIEKYKETKNIILNELQKGIDEELNNKNLELLNNEIEGLENIIEKLPIY